MLGAATWRVGDRALAGARVGAKAARAVRIRDTTLRRTVAARRARRPTTGVDGARGRDAREAGAARRPRLTAGTAHVGARDGRTLRDVAAELSSGVRVVDAAERTTVEARRAGLHAPLHARAFDAHRTVATRRTGSVAGRERRETSGGLGGRGRRAARAARPGGRGRHDRRGVALRRRCSPCGQAAIRVGAAARDERRRDEPSGRDATNDPRRPAHSGTQKRPSLSRSGTQPAGQMPPASPLVPPDPPEPPEPVPQLTPSPDSSALHSG